MKKSNQVRLDNTQVWILTKLLEDEILRFFDVETQSFIYSERNQEVMALFHKFREESYHRGLWDENGDKI